MGTWKESQTGSEQRSSGDVARDVKLSGPLDHQQLDGASAPQAQLQLELAALRDEVAQLRQAGREREVLIERVGQLREANEHLVMAAVNAQTLRDEAEATNRRQNEFLAMLAHELRNPLSPISMAAALLERVPDASRQSLNLTRVIGRQVDHMAHLLDDLLDAARISSGKITLTVEPVLLWDVIEQAIETIQPRVKDRQQQLKIALPPQAVVMEGDRVRLTQVFSNLLGNASKYTGDHGVIDLSAVLREQNIVVTVEDNGAGIAPEVLPHIFDLFTQGPRSLARSEGGLGVGLNVVRNLVDMHAGKVEARSAGIGAGCQFVVTLPVSSDSLPSAPPAPGVPSADHACSVLLIEDNVDACNTLEHFLSLHGHSVLTAYDGVSGLSAALAGQFDVIICDIGLPGRDGFDVIRRLRQSPDGARPYTIALSGYCQSEDRARAMAAGFDHYFVKPLVPEALLDLIASSQCQQRRQEQAL
jgi:signal transduction histidine kinase/ActR/RegA family two-component response regulator